MKADEVDGGAASASDVDSLQARRADPFGRSNSSSGPTRRSKHLTQANPEIDRLGYALSKHVIDMERGFTILTGYGALRIDADDAPRVVQVVRTVLKQQLKRAEAKHD